MNTEDPNRENIMILMTWIVIMKAAIVNIATVNLQGTKVSPEDDLTRMMTITEDHRISITIAGVEDITLMTYMVWSQINSNSHMTTMIYTTVTISKTSTKGVTADESQIATSITQAKDTMIIALVQDTTGIMTIMTMTAMTLTTVPASTIHLMMRNFTARAET